jgi:hypothetical protein
MVISDLNKKTAVEVKYRITNPAQAMRTPQIYKTKYILNS